MENYRNSGKNRQRKTIHSGKNKHSGKNIDIGENIDSAKKYSDSGKKLQLKKLWIVKTNRQ